jgi:hypothetical protein
MPDLFYEFGREEKCREGAMGITDRLQHPQSPRRYKGRKQTMSDHITQQIVDKLYGDHPTENELLERENAELKAILAH